MKKIASISLIVLILLIAVQSVLSFHFCQGELSSVAFQGAQETTCCNNEMLVDAVYEVGCCNNNSVILSTDNYQVPDVQPNFNLLSVFFIVQNHLLATSVFNPDLKEEKVASVGTLFRNVLDRLAFIRVYRI